MPSANIIVESKIKDSFRVDAMRGLFDVALETKNRHEWNIELPIEELDWNVGLIVGSSGSGKTTVAKNLFGKKAYHESFSWGKTASVLDDFPKEMTVQDITDLLSKVGFSSPPSWTKPFHVLSNGQKFRVELARVLSESRELTVIDEFTSVVDRNVAKIGSYAVSKSAKKLGKKIVCLSCHRDIVDWLEPDWVYDMDTNTFSARCLRRPKIKLRLEQVHSKAWELFKEHHYLTGSISNSAQCFVAFWGDIPVAFTSYINMFGKSLKNCRRGHRTVVLPDYQGVGIGNMISDAIGEYCLSQGLRFMSTTSHPAFTQSRIRNKKWRLKRKPSRTCAYDGGKEKGKGIPRAWKRLTCGFEYKG